MGSVIQYLLTWLEKWWPLLVLAVFLWWKECNGPVSTTTTHIDTTYIASKDPIHNITPTNVPVPNEIHNHYETFAPPITDTNAIRSIMMEFFTELFYNDTIKNDSVDIILKERVFKNHLKRDFVGYRWKVPSMVIKETITNTVHKNDFYVGLGSCFRQTGINNITGEVLIETKDWAFGGGYGWDFNLIKPILRVSIYKKLTPNKKKPLWNKNTQLSP